MKRSWVWQYATRDGDRAFCTLCPEGMRNEFSCRGGTTGSIGKHLKVLHSKTPDDAADESLSDSKEESSRTTASPPRERALPTGSTSKFRAGADAALIDFVRDRPVLYDQSHSQYLDNSFKNALWNKIGKQLNISPNACKTRWNNIRDNYRKAWRKRGLRGAMRYKYSSQLVFMDAFYKGQFDSSEALEFDISTKTEPSDDSDGFNEEETDQEEENTEAKSDADNSEADALSVHSESVVHCDLFDKSANISISSQDQVVDTFLAAIGTSLKALSPYHLSLAKAEIFATVHKYELKGIAKKGWTPRDVNPLS